MSKRYSSVQLVWGILLLLAGLGMFYRIPQVMPKIQSIEHFSSSIIFIRFCFYLVGVLLVGGGIKKIYGHYRHPDKFNHKGNG
jgi:hypothetical protein